MKTNWFRKILHRQRRSEATVAICDDCAGFIHTGEADPRRGNLHRDCGVMRDGADWEKA